VLHPTRTVHDLGRMADVLDADLVDGQLAGVRGALDVGDLDGFVGVHEYLREMCNVLGDAQYTGGE